MSLSHPQKKTGRPPKPASEVRVHTIGVRVNVAELHLLQEKAQSLSLPLSQCVRELALNRHVLRPVVPPVNRTAYAELARLAANLNQLMQYAHRFHDVQVTTSLLMDIKQAVAQLRLEILGLTDDS